MSYEGWVSALAVAFSVLFAVSGTLKIARPQPAAAAMAAVFRREDRAGALTVAARFLGVFELGVCLLVLTATERVAAGLAVLMLLFLGFSIMAYRRGVGCGCFNVRRQTEASRVSSVVRGVVLATAALHLAAAVYAGTAVKLTVGVLLIAGMQVVALGVVVALVDLGVARRQPATDSAESAPTADSAPARLIGRRALLTSVGAIAGAGGLGILSPSAALAEDTVARDSRKEVVSRPLSDVDLVRLQAQLAQQQPLRDYLLQSGIVVDFSTARAEGYGVQTRGLLAEADVIIVDIVGGGWIAYSPDLADDGVGVVLNVGPGETLQKFAWSATETSFESAAMLTQCQRCALEFGFLVLSCVACIFKPDPIGCVGCAGSSGLYFTGNCPDQCTFGSYEACVAIGQYLCAQPRACGSHGNTSCRLCECSCPEGCSGVIGGPICYTVYDQQDYCISCGCCCPSESGFATADLTAEELAAMESRVNDIYAGLMASGKPIPHI